MKTLDDVQSAQCEPAEQATQCKLLMIAGVRSVIDNDVELGRRCREAREIAVRPQIALNEPKTRMPGMGEVADVEAIDLGVREVLQPHGDRWRVGHPFDRAAALGATD